MVTSVCNFGACLQLDQCRPQQHRFNHALRIQSKTSYLYLQGPSWHFIGFLFELLIIYCSLLFTTVTRSTLTSTVNSQYRNMYVRYTQTQRM